MDTNASGHVAVSWHEADNPASVASNGVFLATFDETGAEAIPATAYNSDSVLDVNRNPSVAYLDDGRVAMAYRTSVPIIGDQVELKIVDAAGAVERTQWIYISNAVDIADFGTELAVVVVPNDGSALELYRTDADTLDKSDSITIDGGSSDPQYAASVDGINLSSLAVVWTMQGAAMDEGVRIQRVGVGSTETNTAPSLTLNDTITSLSEHTDTSQPIRIASVLVEDDGIGQNHLTLTGTSAAKFDLLGSSLWLKAGETIDFETEPTLSVEIQVDDPSLGGTFEDSALLTISIADANEPADLSLITSITSINEDTPVATRLKVADIVVADPDTSPQTNSLSLSGADAASFEIVGTELFLRAGTTLDFETTPTLSVIVQVDDPSLGSTIEDQDTYTLTINNVNDPPQVSLTNVVTSIPEDTSTAGPIALADIVVTDDSLGTATLSLSGADAHLFQIDSGAGTPQLQLRPGVTLDYELVSSLSLTVSVDDNTVGGTPDDSTNFHLSISDVNEAPSAYLTNQITSLDDTTDTTSPVKIADIVVVDDALGTAALTLSGTDAANFEIVGTELFLRAGTSLDADVKSSYSLALDVDDPTVGSAPDWTVAIGLNLADVNTPPTLTLSNIVASLPENTDTSNSIRIADFTVNDDTSGFNDLYLGAPDAATLNQFEVVSTGFRQYELHLRAGTNLDFETKSLWEVSVLVNDPALAPAPNDVASISLAIQDVNEVPALAASMLVAIDENLDTTNSVLVGHITVSDDGLGTNQLTLSGADAARFEIVETGGLTQLHLRAGEIVDYETQTSLNLTIELDDASVGASPDATVDVSILVNDLNDAPTLALSNLVTDVLDGTDMTNSLRIAEIAIHDDGLGTNQLTLAGADAADFEIIDTGTGYELHLRSGTPLDAYGSDADFDVQVELSDPTLASTPLDTEAVTVNVVPSNLLPQLSLTNIVDELPEDVDTSTSLRVADIVIADDGVGTNTLFLTGADAANFSIVPVTSSRAELRLQAGVVIDYETLHEYNLQVNVNDATIATSTDDVVDYHLAIINVNEAPFDAGTGPTVADLWEDTSQELGDVGSWFGDPDLDDSLTTQVVTAPDWLHVQIVDGQLIVAPTANAHGSADIVIETVDSGGLTHSKTLAVNVLPVNDTTNVLDQEYFTDGPVSGSLLPSLVDADGEALSVVVTEGPAHGALTVAADGSFTFTPNSGFVGTDSFTYVVDDGVSASAPATVSFDVLVFSPDTISSDRSSRDTPADAAIHVGEDEPPVARDAPDGRPEFVADSPQHRDAVGTRSVEGGEQQDGDLLAMAPEASVELAQVIRNGSSTLLVLSSRHAPTPLSTSASSLVSLSGISPRAYTTTIDSLAALVQPGFVWQAMDEFRESSSYSEFRVNSIATGSVATVGSSLVVGYVIWAVRSGVLLSGVLASMPAWNLFDPLVVFATAKAGNGETLAEIVEREKGRLQ